MPAPICFLSDFGLKDGYVGVVKGVVSSIEPALQVIDLSHAVPPGDVRAGAFILMTSLSYFPEGTVFLAVVDPGVGTERAGVAVKAGVYHFVGPDNGVLSWALRQLDTEQQLVEQAGTLRLPAGMSVVQLAESRFWRPTLSATFHGRDIFGPVAAHLAAGVPLGELGPSIQSMRAIPFPMPLNSGRELRGEVIHVDHFGNLITNLRPAHVPPDAVIRLGGRSVAGLSPHYQQADQLIALVGSSGLIEVAAPNGSAATLLGLDVGAAVTASIRRP